MSDRTLFMATYKSKADFMIPETNLNLEPRFVEQIELELARIGFSGWRYNLVQAVPSHSPWYQFEVNVNNPSMIRQLGGEGTLEESAQRVICELKEYKTNLRKGRIQG